MKNMTRILTLATMTLVLACGEEKKKEKAWVRPVRYQTVQWLGEENIKVFSGTASTEKVIALSFRNTGIITLFHIQLGQKVKKGELLAKLDNVQSRLSYEQAVTQQNSAASQMNTAKLNLNRISILYEKGSASLSDFEAAKNSYKTAQESHESARRGVAIQQEQIKFGYLYAPENGIIAAVNSEIDEHVTPGQHIATLNAGTEMQISLGLPESVINDVKAGMEVKASFSSLGNKAYGARVTEVSPAVDENSATYPVTVKLDNPRDEIKSGMAANVTFSFGKRKTDHKLLVAPANAVGQDYHGNFVFLIEGEGDKAKVKKQKITIDKLTTEGFEIKSGLSEGQKIATAGLQTLLDGQAVKL